MVLFLDCVFSTHTEMHAFIYMPTYLSGMYHGFVYHHYKQGHLMHLWGFQFSLRAAEVRLRKSELCRSPLKRTGLESMSLS